MVIVILAYFIVNLIFSFLMVGVAEQKGHYEPFKIGVLVFLFGVLGMLYVIALPDVTTREEMMIFRDEVLGFICDIESKVQDNTLHSIDDKMQGNK